MCQKTDLGILNKAVQLMHLHTHTHSLTYTHAGRSYCSDTQLSSQVAQYDPIISISLVQRSQKMKMNLQTAARYTEAFT